MGFSKKINYPSADRNKVHILDVMRQHINPHKPSKMLEVSSGTGQQAAYFAANLPNLTIQTSEVALEMFESIKAYAEEVRGTDATSEKNYNLKKIVGSE